MKRLRSEIEARAALSAQVDRVDLIDAGIRVSLKLPNSIAEGQQRASSTGLSHAH
jgi:hypothetical protein